MDSFDQIPNEILLEIFKLLSDRDILSVTSTCKRCLKVGRQLRNDSAYRLWNGKTVKCWDIPEELIPDSSENIITEEEGKISLDYLTKEKFDIRRGDLVRLVSRIGSRNSGIAIYNGKEVIDLESEIDDYGYLPKEFKVIDEFPIGYFHLNYKESDKGEEYDWYDFITHNTIVWFDHKPYLPEILRGVTIGKIPNTTMKINGLFTYFTHKNGRRYYIIACRDSYFKYSISKHMGKTHWEYSLRPQAEEKMKSTLQGVNDIPFDSGDWDDMIFEEKPNLDILYL